MSERVYYMCGIDYDFELGKAAGGVRVPPSIEDLQAHQTCPPRRLRNCRGQGNDLIVTDTNAVNEGGKWRPL